MDENYDFGTKVALDPEHPEIFFEELDKFAVKLIGQIKFITPERALEIFDSVELSKKQVREQLLAAKNNSL